MLYLFLGTVLCLFDFNIAPIASNSAYELSLIPDFVGYLLMLRGFFELKRLSPRFITAAPICAALAVYAALGFICDLCGVTTRLQQSAPHLLYLSGGTALLLSLCLYRLTVLGVARLESVCGADLYSGRLLHEWWVLAAAESVGFLAAPELADVVLRRSIPHGFYIAVELAVIILHGWFAVLLFKAFRAFSAAQRTADTLPAEKQKTLKG